MRSSSFNTVDDTPRSDRGAVWARVMPIKPPWQATTTPKGRATIQASNATARFLGERQGTTQQTVWAWHKRDSVEDRSDTRTGFRPLRRLCKCSPTGAHECDKPDAEPAMRHRLIPAKLPRTNGSRNQPSIANLPCTIDAG
jgi:hypothetical protein